MNQLGILKRSELKYSRFPAVSGTPKSRFFRCAPRAGSCIFPLDSQSSAVLRTPKSHKFPARSARRIVSFPIGFPVSAVFGIPKSKIPPARSARRVRLGRLNGLTGIFPSNIFPESIHHDPRIKSRFFTEDSFAFLSFHLPLPSFSSRRCKNLSGTNRK